MWKDPNDVVLYRKMVESDQLYDLFADLNKKLDDVRRRLLGIKPLPQIEEIFAEVRREECHRCVMLGGSTILTIETLELAACGSNNCVESRENKKWCDHCQKPNHTKDTY